MNTRELSLVVQIKEALENGWDFTAQAEEIEINSVMIGEQRADFFAKIARATTVQELADLADYLEQHMF